MGPTRWQRDALLTLVEGKQVMMRAPDASDLPVPSWLGPAASELGDLDSVQSVDATHPEDRAQLVDSFVTALGCPGEPQTCQIRVEVDGRWQHRQVVWLNLLDHPEVQGILCTTEEVDGPPIQTPGRGDGGQHEDTHWMILQLDDQGLVLSARGAVNEILGRTAEELIGSNAIDHVHPQSMASAIDNWISLQQDRRQTRTARQEWRRRDQSGVWLEASFLVHEDQTVEIVLVDITARMASEQALAASQAELAALAEDLQIVADEVPLPVFRCAPDGRIEFRNSQWHEALETNGENKAVRLHDVVRTHDHAALDTMLQAVIENPGEPLSIEVQAADHQRILSIRCRGVGEADRLRVVGSVADITATVHLHHLATHDELTGLANRTMIAVRLDESLTEDRAGTVVVFIDLDGFKQVNDNYGHDVGDATLVEVANRLAAAVRPGDLAARYGGDEFVVVCGGVAPGDEAKIVARLEERVFSEPIILPDGKWNPAASIGTARPSPGDDPAALLRRADQAMFLRKRQR